MSSVIDTRWQRVRRRLGPVTRQVPYGHVASAAATYAKTVLPGLSRPQRRFVIFAQGRSGSTLLTDLLNSHPQIYCADEILTWPRRWPQAFAAACSVGHRAEVYGFKVKLYQLTEAQQLTDPGAFLRGMHASGWQVIHLRRQNVLRQALSAMVAEQRDVFHLAVDAEGPAPVHIDVDNLLWRAQQRQEFGVAEEQALDGIPHLRLSYEDDLLEPAAQGETAGRVFSWLGLPPAAVSVRLRKIVPDELDRIVSNHREVLDAVIESPYAPLLERA